jgi:hypothetical protein
MVVLAPSPGLQHGQRAASRLDRGRDQRAIKGKDTRKGLRCMAVLFFCAFLLLLDKLALWAVAVPIVCDPNPCKAGPCPSGSLNSDGQAGPAWTSGTAANWLPKGAPHLFSPVHCRQPPGRRGCLLPSVVVAIAD